MKKKFSFKDILIWLAAVGFFVAMGLWELSLEDSFAKAFGVFTMLLGIGIFVLPFIAINQGKKKEAKEKAKMEAEKRAREQFLNQVRSGKWAFPSLQFYNTCANDGVTASETDFERAKIKLHIQKLFRELNVSEADCKSYIDRAVELFQQGKQLKEAEERTPVEGTLDKEEQKAFELQSSYGWVTGLEKRRAMLRVKIAQQRQEIEDLEKATDAAATLSNAIYSSAAHEKKTDWAIAGGMASAIGGPGLGAAVAMNTMAKNAEIDARNAANIQRVSQLLNGLSSPYQSLRWAKEKLTELEEEFTQLGTKVVLSHLPKDIITVVSDRVQTNKTNTTFSVTIKNSYSPENIDASKVVIDGYFRATIYCDKNTVVDQFVLPLPTFGVKCNSRETITGISKYYMKGQHSSYRAELEPIKFWAMER